MSAQQTMPTTPPSKSQTGRRSRRPIPLIPGVPLLEQKRSFTIAEAAFILNLSVGTLERLVARSEIDSLKIGRLRRFGREQIERFIARQEEDARGA